MSAATVWEQEIANEADLLNFVVTLNAECYFAKRVFSHEAGWSPT